MVGRQGVLPRCLCVILTSVTGSQIGWSILVVMERANKNADSCLAWLLAAFAGLCLGGIGTLLPFYFHALNDWDLSDKTTLFPREIGIIVQTYSQFWISGAIAGLFAGMGFFALYKRFFDKKTS